jgi:hypothetical protein
MSAAPLLKSGPPEPGFFFWNSFSALKQDPILFDVIYVMVTTAMISRCSDLLSACGLTPEELCDEVAKAGASSG